MNVLSRTEEMFLLAIWRLGDDAYGVTIAHSLTGIAGKDWSLGAIYVPLERLENKGYLRSTMGKATNRRGGRSKRLYRLTEAGLNALVETRALNQAIWLDISIASLKEGYDD